MKKNIIIGVLSLVSIVLSVSFTIQYYTFKNEVNSEKQKIINAFDGQQLATIERLILEKNILDWQIEFVEKRYDSEPCNYYYFLGGLDYIEIEDTTKRDNELYKYGYNEHICPYIKFFNSDEGKRLVLIKRMQNLIWQRDDITARCMTTQDAKTVEHIYDKIDTLEKELIPINKRLGVGNQTFIPTKRYKYETKCK